MYAQSFAKFEQATGIKVNIVTIGGEFGPALPLLLDSELAPDIVDFPQPGFLATYVNQGRVLDVRTFLDEGYLRQQYGQPLLEAAMVEGQMAGVWHGNNLKSQVWYSPAAFQEAGYEVPRTWDELMELSKQMVVDGKTPWCIGIESGAHSGWRKRLGRKYLAAHGARGNV